VIVVAGLVALVAWWLLTQTVFGRRLYAVGSNARATHLIGVDVRRTQLLAFVASGTIAGLGGVLLLARNGGATSDNGMMMLFPALTAVLLSTIVIELGRPSVPGVVVAILFIAVTVSGLTLVGTPPWVNQVFNGAALLIAVAFARLARRRQGPASRRASG
jgi:ribose transport system permease protein